MPHRLRRRGIISAARLLYFDFSPFFSPLRGNRKRRHNMPRGPDGRFADAAPLYQTEGGAIMDSFGFIHGELDTKILILYVLRRLPRPVDAQTLTELCSFDTGVGWFDYADCLAGLEDTGHVERAAGRALCHYGQGRGGRRGRRDQPAIFRARQGLPADRAGGGEDAPATP